jgi:hypothetical protein
MRLDRVYYGYNTIIYAHRASSPKTGASLWTNRDGPWRPTIKGARMTSSHAHLDRTTAELLCNLGSV